MLMDRRGFISLMTTSFAASLDAQPAQAPRRIGILGGGTVPRSGLAAEMAKYGWVEGKNLVIERRIGQGQTVGTSAQVARKRPFARSVGATTWRRTT
jgi:hypothetical protein